MQNCMLDTADILVNRGPVIYFVFCKRCFIVFRVGIAQVIPGGAQEGVHGVGFASCRLAAFRAGAVYEAFGSCQRGYCTGIKLNIFRQHNRQLVFRHKHFSAVRAVNNRNRRAPVTLAAD